MVRKCHASSDDIKIDVCRHGFHLFVTLLVFRCVRLCVEAILKSSCRVELYKRKYPSAVIATSFLLLPKVVESWMIFSVGAI